ncbi:MAG: methyltransferase [Microcella sp.]|uniref:class I SAM-dependent methyltransferase n=1 Tax=Microcella sp. TaxID=1913979 RepID=UPI003314CF90
MAADHYFSDQPQGELVLSPLTVTLADREIEVVTAGGVFSPRALDAGTRVLLTSAPPPPTTGHVLDLGCGWGPIALSLALRSPDATVWAVDVNERSLDLTRRNAARLGLSNVTAVRPEQVPDDVRFSTIWSNPPIRVGKHELHGMLELWLPRLELDASAWLVVARNLGSDSLHRWLEESFAGWASVARATADKGYRVLRVRRTAGEANAL